MRQVSLKIKYALTAIVELGQHSKEGAVQSRVIAEKYGIPHNYLEQVMVELKRGGFVKSFRGSQGGYQLTREPMDIWVSDIMTCLDGPMQLNKEKDHQELAFFWQEAEQKVNDVFNVSINTLVERKQRQEKVLMYTI